MSKFKVGDRVRLLRDNTYARWGRQGEEGTVMAVTEEDTDCDVNFDESGKWHAQWDDLERVVTVAPATATPDIHLDLEFLPFPQVGDSVLIPGWIAGITNSARGTNYNIVFETQNRRVSLHFLEEDFILEEDDDDGGCVCANNDNGPLPTADTAKAFDAIGDWLRAVAVRRAA